MAYSAALTPSVPIPSEPMVLGPIRVTRSTSELNYGVYVPWERCKLTYAYAVTTTVVTDATFEIDLELNAAAGTEMMSVSIAVASSAVGDIDEFTVTSDAACKNLGRQDTARDLVNIEIGEHASGAGAADIYLYFEPEWA